MSLITIKNIRKQYGKRVILDGVSLTADPGMCVGILGMNGSGKSTLLQILAGEIRADAGHFLYSLAAAESGDAGQPAQGGEDSSSSPAPPVDLLTHAPLREELVGYAPQGTPLIAELTALDNLRLWYPKEKLAASLESGPLALLGIPSFLKTPVRKMSGGMKKRLSIGCAIAGDPAVLLLDEPGAALDLLCKEAMENYIHAFLARGGIIFLVTHDVQELSLCSTSYILKNGTLTPYHFDGDTRALTEALRS